MGRLFKTYLTGTSIFCCLSCKTHLTPHDQLISKQFQGRHGAAFLFNTCSNITVGESEDRTLTTGMHVVADIFCIDCGELLGWKYEFAKEESQKYKVGKYILEKEKIQKEISFGSAHQQHSLVALDNSIIINYYSSTTTLTTIHTNTNTNTHTNTNTNTNTTTNTTTTTIKIEITMTVTLQYNNDNDNDMTTTITMTKKRQLQQK